MQTPSSMVALVTQSTYFFGVQRDSKLFWQHDMENHLTVGLPFAETERRNSDGRTTSPSPRIFELISSNLY